jgi:hypothetical protein
MEILIGLIDKLLYVALFMSILFIIRHVFLFYRNLMDPEPKKYSLTRSELFYLGLSIAYIINCLVNGIVI